MFIIMIIWKLKSWTKIDLQFDKAYLLKLIKRYLAIVIIPNCVNSIHIQPLCQTYENQFKFNLFLLINNYNKANLNNNKKVLIWK